MTTEIKDILKAIVGTAGNSTPAGAMTTIFTDLVVSVLSNPEAMEGLSQFFNPCHTGPDVAMDALDAYKHGHLTKSQAMRIVQVCLEEQGKTVDVEARETLEKLFR
ncbi:hypothetical protein [Spirulina sp. 06S082]|uniref:hypothetical protein n=1 Tax=Spirulina sp. 06S082 TaxID=3110248 RepID=UPI002B1F563C|nr:hypothetical protein [Spirulina sp. 06S082]MEA5471683.1 hypothetical protein [Spirulina sp. 06S082]